MNGWRQYIVISVALGIPCLPAAQAAPPEVALLYAAFETLGLWNPPNFQKIEAHRQYDIATDGTNNVLQAGSEAAA